MQIDDLKKQLFGHITGEFAGLSLPSGSDSEWDKLFKQCQACTACELYKSATNLVFGEGSCSSGVMVIGEAPGREEDEQGRPFVGRSGQLLRKTLSECGLSPDSVFIGNILKHRPPNNRDPLPEEITACTPWLEAQLAILKPKVILTLGNFSTRYILKTTEGITRLRGNIQKSPFGIDVCPTFHPAAILRNRNNLELFQNDIRTAISHAGKLS